MGAKDSVQFGGHIDLTSNAADIVKELKLVQNALKAISDIANGMGLEKYWRDQDSAISSLRKSYNEFLSVQNRDTASELIKTTNALKATGVDIARNVSGVEKLDEALSKARSAAPDIASIYNIDSFRNLFNALDTIRDSGQDANVVISKLANNSDVSQLNQQVRTLEIQLANSRNEAASLEGELKTLKDNTGVGELEEQVERLQRRLERVREIAEEEFDNFLRGHEIQPDEWEFSSYYENIRDGSETAIDAISRFKVEYQHLFDKSDNGNAALALFDSFQLKISSLTSKIEELTSMIQDMVENGVKTASDGSTNSLQGIADAMRQINDASSNGASSAQQNITQLVERLNDLAGVDITALTNVRGILLSIVNMNDLKITPTPAKNIGLLLDAVKSFGDTGANVALPDFKKIFGGLEINTTSLKDLATYLPKFAGLDLSGLSGLSGVDFSGFNNVNVDKSISSIAKLATAVNGVDVSNVNNFLTGLDFSKLQAASTGVDKGLGTVINALVKLKSLNDGDLASVLSLPFENLSKITINENAAQSINQLADSMGKLAGAREELQQIIDVVREFHALPASNSINTPISDDELTRAEKNLQQIVYQYDIAADGSKTLIGYTKTYEKELEGVVQRVRDIYEIEYDDEGNANEKYVRSETLDSIAQKEALTKKAEKADAQAAITASNLSVQIQNYANALKNLSTRASEAGIKDEEHTKVLNEQGEALNDLLNKLSTTTDASGLMAIQVEFAKIKDSANEAKISITEALNAYRAGHSISKDNNPTEYYKAATKLESVKAQINNDINKSSKARFGKSSEDYRSLVDLQAEIAKLETKLKSGAMSGDEFARELEKIRSSASTSANSIRQAGEMTLSFGDRIKKNMSTLSAYFSVHRSIMTIIRYVRDLIKTSIELDKEMGTLRIVTNETADAYERYADSISDTAKEIGSSMTDLISATTTFARLGYTLDESSVLAKYTAMLQQVGDIDASSAQDAVTAITKAFADEVDVDNIESVMDRLVVVGRIIAHVCSNVYLVIGYNGQSRFGTIA